MSLGEAEFNDLMGSAGEATGLEVGSEESFSEGPQTIPEENKEPEYEYTWNGKQIKEPVSMILKRAAQGYDYSQQMNKFNLERKSFENQYKTYREIDEYAKSNPGWWERVQQAYNERENQQAEQQPLEQPQQEELPPHLKTVMDKLSSFEKFMQEQQNEKMSIQRQQEDKALEEEISSIRKSYPNIDFVTPDESGKSLEYKVLEYAQENGIRNFKTAFRDFYHDNLVSLYKEQGKESAVKDLQKKTKLGLLDKSPAPSKKLSTPENLRTKSYNDIVEETLAELGVN